MCHCRKNSTNSSASISSTFTCSPKNSVEIYQGRLKPWIGILAKSNVLLQHLVREAEQIIKESFAPDPRSTFTYKNDHDEVSVQLDKVILAMLSHAEECGGERGLRYIASAIVACSKQDAKVGALEALGTTWLTHLLFIFKTGDAEHLSEKTQKSFTEDNEEHLSEKRQKSFADDVKLRDGYTCVLTGYQDLSHPQPNLARSPLRFKLQACHIFRRAIGSFSNDPNSPSFKSVEATFDILVNFTQLSREVLEELGSNLDDPSNGITLEPNAHNGFDDFHWCLKKTETEDEYEVKIFNGESIFRLPPNNRISFRDHSNDFSSDSTRKNHRPVALPDPRYIALHSAMAEIMNTSDAGRFFDRLFKRYEDNRRRVSACQSWSEFESLVEEEMLRESVTNMFHLANVH